MGRGPRVDVGDIAYHVINRANGRARMFDTDGDYRDFEHLLDELRETFDMRILAYVIMPNHWHLLLYPRHDDDLSSSMQWLGTTHSHRLRTFKQTVGYGHVYQGRYKSFPIEEDHHLLTVLKYIERNPARAKLVEHPHDWRWSSAYRRVNGTTAERKLLSESPVRLPQNYLRWINEPEPSEKLDVVRDSVKRNIPFGNPKLLAM